MTARRGRPAPPQELRDDRRPQRPRELLHEVGGPARRDPVEQLSDRADLQPERRHAPLLSFCPPSATTTTVATTTILSASSTTTTVFTTTTTTAPPLPCPGLSGLVRVQCQLAAALGRPLCGNEVVPPAVDHALRAKLNAANAALGSATTATGRKGKKLRKRAVGNLRAASARTARAVKAKNAGRHVSASCAGTIAGLTGQLVQEIAGP